MDIGRRKIEGVNGVRLEEKRVRVGSPLQRIQLCKPHRSSINGLDWTTLYKVAWAILVTVMPRQLEEFNYNPDLCGSLASFLKLVRVNKYVRYRKNSYTNPTDSIPLDSVPKKIVIQTQPILFLSRLAVRGRFVVVSMMIWNSIRQPPSIQSKTGTDWSGTGKKYLNKPHWLNSTRNRQFVWW